MKAEKLYDFTNVKIGDKVITDLQFYSYPKMYTKKVVKITKTTFQVESYDEINSPNTGKIYKKDGGTPYPKDRSDHRSDHASVWTQEIQDEYDAFVADRNEKSKLKGEIENILASLAKTAKYCDDVGTLEFVKNTLIQATADINNLVRLGYDHQEK
jgi:hypothetical protein